MRESAPLAHKPAGMTFDEAAAVCDGAILALPYGMGTSRTVATIRQRRAQTLRPTDTIASATTRRLALLLRAWRRMSW